MMNERKQKTLTQKEILTTYVGARSVASLPQLIGLLKSLKEPHKAADDRKG